jgi:hypothetical protein
MIVPAVAALVALGALARADEKVPMSWRGQRFTSAEFPKDLSEPARKAATLWEPWALKAGYRMDFDEKARLLLATRRGSARADAQMQVVVRAEKWQDGLFASPDAAEAETAVMLVLKDEKDHASALQSLGSAVPALASWAAAAAGKELGFVLVAPLSGAFVESAPGLKEWNPDHELLNRTVQLLVLRRYGVQPNWIAQGLAWEAEMSVYGSIYCYPYRSGFVARVEHNAWPGELAKEIGDPASKTFAIEELAGWKRGRFDGSVARHAWGFAHFLAAEKKDALPVVLEELHAFRAKNERKTHEDGSWEIIPGYEVPVDTQLELMKKSCGEDVLEAAAAWYRKSAGAK